MSHLHIRLPLLYSGPEASVRTGGQIWPGASCFRKAFRCESGRNHNMGALEQPSAGRKDQRDWDEQPELLQLWQCY